MHIYECLMIMLMLCKSSYARLTPRVLQSPVRGSLSLPPLFLSLHSFVFCPFFFAPARWPIGCNLKNPSVAREAQLLIIIGHGRVWLVGSSKQKLRRVIKRTECPFIWEMPFRLGEKYYYMIVKKESGIAPLWRPWGTQAESARVGAL